MNCKGYTSTSIDGGGAEGLPDNGFTDVGSNEQGNPRPKTITLLQQLVLRDKMGNWGAGRNCVSADL